MFLEGLSCFALTELPRSLLAAADAGMEVSKRSECLESQRPYVCRGVSAGGALNTRPLVGGGRFKFKVTEMPTHQSCVQVMELLKVIVAILDSQTGHNFKRLCSIFGLARQGCRANQEVSSLSPRTLKN